MNGGVTVYRKAQSICMIIEFVMLMAVLKAGIALLLPNLRASAHSVAVRDTASSRSEEATQQPVMAHRSIAPVEAMPRNLVEMEPD